MPASDVVIVGAGLAGAATAFFLSRERGVRVLLLEQEARAGVHSSGRNAGLVRRASGDAELDPLCDEGAAFLAAPPADFPGATSFRRTGSFLIVPPERALDHLEHPRGAPRPRMRLATIAELAQAVPFFRPSADGAAIRIEDDGVVEAKTLLDGFLEGARARGVILRSGTAAALEAREGRIIGVRTQQGAIAAGCVVDAAGAWAGELARAAGTGDRGLSPTRRHLAVTRPDARVDPRSPWVWDTVRGFYCRPEAGGLLLCACDEAPDPPGDCAVAPDAAAAIVEKAARCLPALGRLELVRVWAGHRTKRADGRFVLGADPRLRGLVWAAGLGGHGVTTSAAVGRRAAEAALAALRMAS